MNRLISQNTNDQKHLTFNLMCLISDHTRFLFFLVLFFLVYRHLRMGISILDREIEGLNKNLAFSTIGYWIYNAGISNSSLPLSKWLHNRGHNYAIKLQLQSIKILTVSLNDYITIEHIRN